MRLDRHASTTSATLVSILLAILAIGIVVSAPGCGKSLEEAKKEADEKKKKKEKPKPPFDRLQVTPEPNDKVFIDPGDKSAQVINRYIKPGHWTGVLVTTTANHFDFGGELSAEALDKRSNPIALPRSTFSISTARPAALPKAQRKSLETLFFAPCSDLRTSTFMASALLSQDGSEAFREQEIFQHLPSYEYFMFVLARNPTRYGYWKVLDSVKPPIDDFASANEVTYYRVLIPRPGGLVALPTRSLCWTSIAHIVWDDLLPADLTPQQQQAMVDWLHWGGSLILSGPQTLDTLRGSFLEPYLPAASGGSVQLEQADFTDLNAHWSIGDQRDLVELKVAAPWSAIKLARHPASEFVPGTGELVATRRVGRGRVVATAFRLTERELINWRCFDSFCNAVLLGRLPRRFDPQEDQFAFLADPFDTPDGNLDPALITGVRYFTRDARFDTPPKVGLPNPVPTAVLAWQRHRRAPTIPPPALVDDVEAETESDRLRASAGVAGWDDFSAVSDAARLTLREAAGISVPNRRFVMWMLGIYLVVVVPVNWLVFRILGRVEWAWIAVPVLALAWGLVVVWLAQLDIGFARAEREVDVLEVQAGYDRAHLTRYAALYTSLSTSYDVGFDDPAAVAQPFASGVELLRDQGQHTVELLTAGDTHLDGFSASSNTTGMVHGEQMVALGGNLIWSTPADGPATVQNGTKLKISGAAVVRRRFDDDDKPIDEGAWLGDLLPGATAAVEWKPAAEALREIAIQRDRVPLTATVRPKASLSLRDLTDLSQKHDGLRRGEVRLVGWRDGGMPGMQIAPASAQARRATLVVANLSFEHRTPRPDENLRALVPVDDELTPAQP